MHTITSCDDQVTRLTASDGPPVFLDHDELTRRMAAKAGAIVVEPAPARNLVRRVWAWLSRTGGNPAQLASWAGCDEAEAAAAAAQLAALGYVTATADGYIVELPLIEQAA